MKEIQSKASPKALMEFTLENDFLKVTALNYGGIITGIYRKDEEDINLILSYENVDDYFEKPWPYLNAIVGPTAGRIAYGKYTVNNKEVSLSTTQETHHLHGGDSGLSSQFFEVAQTEESTITFKKKCTHTQDGYEGMFDYFIQYSLIEDKLEIKMSCTPEKETILNMTSHLYFNLSGNMEKSIHHHLMKVPANQRVKIHEDKYPYEIVGIEDKEAYDFNQLKEIDLFLKASHEEVVLCKGLDTPWLLNHQDEIQVIDPESKRALRIKTDAPCVVAYSASFFDESLILNQGQKGYPYCGLALETQDIPNAINLKVPNMIYGPKKPYQQVTTYQFYKEEV